MKNSQDLLNRIHRNTQMGVDTLPQLAMKSKDHLFRTTLRQHYEEYQKLNQSAEEMMKRRALFLQNRNK